MVNLDFSAVPSREILAEGTYNLSIEKVEAKETGPNSKNPGSPMLAVQFKDIDGGGYIFENLMCVGAGAFRLGMLLEALGYDPKDLSEFDEQELVGQIIKAKVIQVENTYEGETSMVNSIKKFSAA